VEVEYGFDISPDGRQVAFSWNPGGSWDIYEIHLGYSAPPNLITTGPGSKFHPRYSPDGKYLAYTVDFNGSEAYHLFYMTAIMARSPT